MSGLRARRKGHGWEREVAKLFREAMPMIADQIKRGYQYRGGQDAPDVELPCFWVEAKRQKQANLRAALRQAVEGAPKDRWPIAVCKDDRQAPVVLLRLEDFLELVGQWAKETMR